MKRYTKTLIIAQLLFISCIIIEGCNKKNDPAPTQLEILIGNISKTWTVNNVAMVTLNNEDITADFSGFEITVDGNLNYTTNSSSIARQPIPWPASGSFTLNDALTQLTRDDGLVISFTLSNSTDQLVMSFNFAEQYTDSSEGRVNATSGDWVMDVRAKQ